MNKKSKRFSSFAGKIRTNTAERKLKSGFGYINKPDELEFFSPEIDSKYVFDILPYIVSDKNHPDKNEKKGIAIENELWYKRPFSIHRNIGAQNKSYICPTTIGKRCPICEHQNLLRKENADEDEVKALKLTNKNLYVINLYDKKRKERTMFLFETSDFSFQQAFEDALDDKEEFDMFPDLFEGCSIEVKYTESNFGGHKYAKPTRFDFVERTEQYDEDFVDTIPNLDKCLIVLGYDELKAIFFASQEDEDEDEKPVKKTTSKLAKKAAIAEDEADEDEADEDEEDEDEAPRQRKTLTKKPVKKAIKDEDEDEDDEDEKPVKKPTAKPVKKVKENECPEGYEFGVDNDKYEECEDCLLWNECAENRPKKRK